MASLDLLSLMEGHTNKDTEYKLKVTGKNGVRKQLNEYCSPLGAEPMLTNAGLKDTSTKLCSCPKRYGTGWSLGYASIEWSLSRRP
jgi:hypothetical protein